MFDGLCAYCGKPLGGLWQVDRRAPIKPGKKAATAELFGSADKSYFPACTRCGTTKGGATVEEYRARVRASIGAAKVECANLRLALDFKLARVAHSSAVKFHFEEVWDV